MTRLPDLGGLSHAEKDVLIRALWEQVEKLSARVAELEAKLGGPPIYDWFTEGFDTDYMKDAKALLEELK